MHPTIGLVAPASGITKEQFEVATNYLHQQGFKLKYPDELNVQHPFYTAGSKEQRAFLLNQALNDPDIDILLCVKGGYGSCQILDLLDKNILSSTDKIFLGYSDITLLNLFFLKNAPNLKIYFSPNLIDIAYALKDKNTYFLEYFSSFLKHQLKIDIFTSLLKQTKVFRNGIASGELVGGTLTIILNSLGTSFEIDTYNKILFIEETKEYFFKIERMLYQLKYAGKFENVKGIILGDFSSSLDYRIPFGKDIEQLLYDFFKEYKYPILYNFPIGHGFSKIPVPINRFVSLDTREENFGLSAKDVL